jgi:hypothetical protein
MDVVEFDFPNANVVGRLYRDNDVQYLLGDVMYVELSNGYIVDVDWDKDESFLVVVYKEYYGNQFVSVPAHDVGEVVSVINRLVRQYEA